MRANSVVYTSIKVKEVFGLFKKLFNFTQHTVYIRFKNEKVHFSFFPEEIHYTELPLIALNKTSKKPKVTAVGEAVKELPPEDPSVVYAPFEPFEPEVHFDLAEKTLRTLMQKEGVLRGALIAPRIVIHPDKSTLSETERQAYEELGLSIGGREVVVHVGESLNDVIIYKLFKHKNTSK